MGGGEEEGVHDRSSEFVTPRYFTEGTDSRTGI